MNNLIDFYNVGLPIDTEVGLCDFLKVKDYPKYALDLQAMSMTKEGIIYAYHKEYGKDAKQFIETLQQLNLYEIALGLEELQTAYHRIFKNVFVDESSLNKINESNFNSIRKTILNMNCVKEKKINPNPEIQAAIERSERLKSQDENMTFSDIVSSVVIGNKVSYSEVNEYTIYQMYYAFHRIAAGKSYATSVLFSTVSTEKINIESWAKPIDLLEDDKHGLDRNEFQKISNMISDT
ncbi:hypothetical protein COE51_16385 [Bacillus pseudomycoides]|nr:hypothetical protein COE51_16385 [Bacillus pseudomycoides]